MGRRTSGPGSKFFSGISSASVEAATLHASGPRGGGFESHRGQPAPLIVGRLDRLPRVAAAAPFLQARRQDIEDIAALNIRASAPINHHFETVSACLTAPRLLGLPSRATPPASDSLKAGGAENRRPGTHSAWEDFLYVALPTARRSSWRPRDRRPLAPGEAVGIALEPGAHRVFREDGVAVGAPAGP